MPIAEQDTIHQLVKEYHLHKDTSFILEQSGNVYKIAHYLCDELQAIDSRGTVPFVYAAAVNRVIAKLRPLWQKFVEKEYQDGYDIYTRRYPDQLLLFQRYLQSEWDEDSLYETKPVPLLEKLVQDERESHRLSTLVVTLKHIRTRPANGDDHQWTIILERFILRNLENLLDISDDEENLVCSDLKDLGKMMENCCTRLRGMQHDQVAGFLVQELGSLRSKLFVENGQFTNWLTKVLDLPDRLSRPEHYCLVIFESSSKVVRDALNMPLEFICLPEEHKLHSYFANERKFVFVDRKAKLAAVRRFRSDESSSEGRRPLSLSDLSFSGQHLPRIKGHIIVAEDSDEERTKEMQNQAHKLEEIWNIMRVKERYGSLGKMEVRSFAQQEAMGQYFKEKLDDMNWHLIHIIGHSEPQRGIPCLAIKGNVILPEDVIGAVKVKPVKAVFFQFCESASTPMYGNEREVLSRGFVECFAQETTIPAILGFRWEIDAPDAGRLFELAYQNWLNRQLELPISLYRAMVEVRGEQGRDPRVWLSPVLIYQDFATDMPEV